LSTLRLSKRPVLARAPHMQQSAAAQHHTGLHDQGHDILQIEFSDRWPAGLG
jgi:hypothetical protein